MNWMNARTNWEKLPLSGESAVLREGALARLEQLAFPTRKQEEYKYLNLKDLRETPWQIADNSVNLNELRQLVQNQAVEGYKTLILVNGMLVPELSSAIQSSSLEVIEMSKALAQSSWTEWHKSQITALANLKAGRDFFDEVSDSHMGRGLVIRVRESAKIQIFSIAAGVGGQSQYAPYQLWFDLFSRAKASVLEWQMTLPGSAGVTLLQPQLLATIGESAHLEWVSAQALSVTDTSVGRSRFLLSKASQLHSLELSMGAKLFRRNLDVYLQAPEAFAKLDGLSMTGQGQVCDFHTLIDHVVGHCNTEQLYKGVLGSGSQTVFNGKVVIRKGAQKASSEQLNKNLLLSSSAEIDSKPELEIHADDVKATHGSAIGQISDEEIFYLRSRAIPEATAREMLALGFVEDLILRISSPEMTEKLRPLLRNGWQNL